MGLVKLSPGNNRTTDYRTVKATAWAVGSALSSTVAVLLCIQAEYHDLTMYNAALISTGMKYLVCTQLILSTINCMYSQQNY